MDITGRRRAHRLAQITRLFRHAAALTQRTPAADFLAPGRRLRDATARRFFASATAAVAFVAPADRKMLPALAMNSRSSRPRTSGMLAPRLS
nr:unnamed protein product [Digitaria exilis]